MTTEVRWKHDRQMATLYPIEIYSAFLLLRAEIEIIKPLRLTDSINRIGNHIELKQATIEPLIASFPVLAHPVESTILEKSSITLVTPTKEPSPSSNPALWREKIPQPVLVTTQTYSLMADVHLEMHESLADHLERYPDEFLPLTNISALWVAGSVGPPHTIQRMFALLNPKTIVTFAPR